MDFSIFLIPSTESSDDSDSVLCNHSFHLSFKWSQIIIITIKNPFNQFKISFDEWKFNFKRLGYDRRKLHI